MDSKEDQNPFDQLEGLLEKQIQLATQNKYADVESITETTNSLVKQLSNKKPDDFKQKQERILQLYKKLDLILSAEKKLVKDQQQQADNVRKIINTYHIPSR
ncbi:MAG: hypothetical protein A2Y12_11025 [Planctomycetes bacterium GWF2_42_9]|nr:MAG: hypothetical protein A2Y12_11025 [Planctomycetes bacterium GWF2_42_9]HAL45275.1 hypothetical protein [Phycisphaerales bacterium]